MYLGEDAVPKKVPKTIENQRVPDETMVHGDEEVWLLSDTVDITVFVLALASRELSHHHYMQYFDW